MRGSARIDHHPYLPPTCKGEREKPYICRLAPFADGFTLEWFDRFDTGAHTLCYGERGSSEKTAVALTDRVARIEGLKENCEYELFIRRENPELPGRCSNIRLLRTGALPEGASVIQYLHPEDTQYAFSGKYLCSPSIVRTDSGRLLVSMDLYGPQMAQNLTLLYYSDDDGANWNYLTDLYPFYWGSLFRHKGAIYILGLTTEYGNLQIACSTDHGETWSAPVTLLYGSNVLCDFGGVHRAPMHFTSYNGRLYTSCEYGCWKRGSHLPAILSVGENEDLMCAENWVCSDFLPFEGKWKEEAGRQGDTIEGNIVLAPDGTLMNVMRWKQGSLLKLKVNTQDADAMPEYVGIEEAPVSDSMFRLISHEDRYLLVTNHKTEAAAKCPARHYRNVLFLFQSKDLKHYTLVKDLINYEDCDAEKVGFQYPALIKEKDTILLAIRSAFNQANSFHDSNYILLYQLKSIGQEDK